MIYPFYRWYNCDLESNETCPKWKADTPICCWTWCLNPQKTCSKPHQALVPSREQLKYRAGAPAMEMNATSFNLVGFWPCWATSRMNQLIRHVLGQGLQAVSTFQTQPTTGKKNDQTRPRKMLNPRSPNSSPSQEPDPPSGFTDGGSVVQWPTVRQPGPTGKAMRIVATVPVSRQW